MRSIVAQAHAAAGERMALELNVVGPMDPRVTELQKQAAARPDVIGLAGGLPADELLPRAALARCLAEVTASRDDALQYGWPEGTEQLRHWIAARLAARGAAIDPECIIVTAGAQQALAIAARLLGGAIAVGDATYAAAIDAFIRSGAQVVASGGTARYVIHGVSNPHGVELADRDALLASSEPLIVDEAYAELRFDGATPRPLLADAPDRTWHVGTISKTIAPGLRVGWLIPPAPHHAAALELKSAADLQTSSLSQAALARLLATTDYDALLARARAAYAERAAALSEALHRHAPSLRFREPEGGFSLWIETDRTGDDIALLRAMLDAGVMVDPGSAFCPGPRETIAVRASYSNAAPCRLAEAARRLARVLA
jgi:2-aminoadipate transaminase